LTARAFIIARTDALREAAGPYQTAVSTGGFGAYYSME
jgi:hypothetical protein